MSLKEGATILKLDPDQLEELVKKWLAQEKETYVDFDRNSGSYDRGLDAVGFLSKERYDGPWDNYQCKQLGKPLTEGEFFAEIGKVFYYSSIKEFTLPRRYIFVAPNGISKAVRISVGSPMLLRQTLLDEWDHRCGTKIIKGQAIPLSEKLKADISNYDFSKIDAWNNHKFVEQPNVRKILHFYIDVNPGQAPLGCVPEVIELKDRPYIDQLIKVYEEMIKTPFENEDAVYQHNIYGKHLREQRRRYYDAEAFHHHFRDNIAEETLFQFDQDVYDGVIDDYWALNGFPRVTAVMKAASVLQVSGIFGKHNSAPNSVKQGVCHQLANKGRLSWKD